MEEILSKSTFGLRKAGLSALAVTLTVGAGFAGAGTAYAAPGDFTADSQPKVMQGADDQAAGDLNYEFANAFTTNTKITFTIDEGNTCADQAGIDKAIAFSNEPSVSLSKDTDTDGDARVPSYTVETDAVDDNCETVGVHDRVTVTLTQPSSGDAGDTFQIDLSDIAYDLGKNAQLGNVEVDVAQGGATVAQESNAFVVNKSFMFIPLVAANPGDTGKTLGTATYSESTPGAYFETGENDVTLTLTSGEFTEGVTPKISVPSGYKVTDGAATPTEGAPKTDGDSTYDFTVVGPQDLTAAEVTVSGLRFDAVTDGATTSTPIAPDQVLLQSDVSRNGDTTAIEDESKAVNVVNFGARHRIGGANRYETAAKLFNAGDYDNGTAVLSGGQKFPDALSANYLAGELNTGTLLTKANELPQATKNALIDNDIETVYVTGGWAAVSEDIEEELEDTRVGGNVNEERYINVVRLAGDNRYGTNERINSWVHNEQGGTEDIAFLAAGTAPYDSLAGGPIAYADDMPLVLTGGKDLNRGEKQQLIDLGVDTVVILGGAGVVSQNIADELDSDGYEVVRLAGDTRYETAAAIATWATEGYDLNDDGDKGDTVESGPTTAFDSSTTHITNGQGKVDEGKGFADALSAGPLAGSNEQVILLSQGVDEVGDGAADYLMGKQVADSNNGFSVATLFALGSTGATSASMIEDAAELIETGKYRGPAQAPAVN